MAVPFVPVTDDQETQDRSPVAQGRGGAVGDDASGNGDGDAVGQRLLAAATAEFAAQGYAGARVAEIARRAGVTTGAIYSRYRGKTELLAAALTEATAGEFDALFADHRFQGRMEDILLIAGSHLVDRGDGADDANAETPGMLLEAFAAARHEADVAALLRQGMSERHDRLEGIVEAAKAGGGIDPAVDTAAVVTFCHAVGLGFLLLEVLDSPMPATDAWEALIGRLVAAVAPTGSSGAAGQSSSPDPASLPGEGR